MDPTYPASSEPFRQRVRDLFAANLPENFSGLGAMSETEQGAWRQTWRDNLGEWGLLAVQWPKEYGGAGLTPLEQLVLAEESARVGVPLGGYNDPPGIQMLGSMLLLWGTEDQRRELMPKILNQDHRWAQGFSEPEAGSDLANVKTRALLRDGRWIINGQKVWTSYGHLATHIFILCRTEVRERKHDELSFLLVPVDQPGVEIRPLRTITGEPEFNEVFFTDAQCLEGDIVGSPGDGWKVAMALLGYERGEGAAVLAIKFRVDYERLLELARVRGKLDDPAILERLGECRAQVEQMHYLGLQTVSGWLAGSEIGAEASVAKVFWSEWVQAMTTLALDIIGPDAATPEGLGLQGVSYPAAEPGTPNTTGAWVDYFLRGRAATIYAGTSEIQKTIIGERLLGLPR